jgi:hypothetical protein
MRTVLSNVTVVFLGMLRAQTLNSGAYTPGFQDRQNVPQSWTQFGLQQVGT